MKGETMIASDVVLDALTDQVRLSSDEVELKDRLDDNLNDDLGLDSLDIIMVIMAIEDKFGLDMDTDDAAIAKIATVQDLINYTEARAKGVKV